MKQVKEIYNLKADHNLIKLIQESTADKKSNYGYKVENKLVFGTKEC